MNKLLDVQTFIGRLAEGRSAETRLVSTVEMIFQRETMQYAYELLRERDPFASALTGDHSTDLWRAVRDGTMELARGRPLEAKRRTDEVRTLHPMGEEPGSLAEIETNWVSAESMVEGNNIPAAIQFCNAAIAELDRFVDQVKQTPAEAASQVRIMLQVMTGTEELNETISEEALLDGWILGRGVTLLSDLVATLSNLLRATRQRESAADVASWGEDILLLYHDAVELAFGKDQLATVTYKFGDVWTGLDDRRAYQYFDTAAELLGTMRGIKAAVNAANSLLRLGEYAEAEARYASYESLFESIGDPLSAARVWVSENVANWKRRRNPDIHDSLVGAIQFFEESLPSSADTMTRFTEKKYVENGYFLLIAVIASLQDRSETRLNELLGALWAVSSRDLLAQLEPKEAEVGWARVLSTQQRPLSIMKNSLRPFPGTAVLHVVPGIDCLVWVAYGYDDQGRLRFETCLGDEAQADLIGQFLTIAQAQQEADVIDDAARVVALNAQVEELGDRIGAGLSPSFVEFLSGMHHIQFMPHPFGDLDEFPLSGVRVNGKWLTEAFTIMRSPTVNQLQEWLSPNRAVTFGNSQVAIVLGDPETGGPLLQRAREHGAWVENAMKGVYQFKPRISETVDTQMLHNWLEGDVGVMHYVGHGYSNVVSEGLPLSQEESFTIYDVDRLSGAKTPFIFICACEAARVRYGQGGYQTGVASKLTERGAPSVLAFSVPIPESRAYTIAQRFYREALTVPLGEAVQNTQQAMAGRMPTYAWLALMGYGDPAFRLAEMTNEGEPITNTAGLAVTWHSALRNHAVLRTNKSEQAAREKLTECPEALRPLANTILEGTFRGTPTLSPSQLDNLEATLLSLSQSAPVEALTLRCLVCLERAHRVGLDERPSHGPDSPEATRRMVDDMRFVLLTGGALWDMRLHGLGHALLGRLITIDQNNTAYSRIFLEQAAEKLLECAPMSPFVERIRTESIEILRAFPSQANPY